MHRPPRTPLSTHFPRPPTSQSSSTVASNAHSFRHPQTLNLNLWIHEDAFFKHEVYLNYKSFPPGTVNPGDVVELRPTPQSDKGKGAAEGKDRSRSSSTPGGKNRFANDDRQRYLFVVRETDGAAPQRAGGNVVISVARHVADIFGFKSWQNVSLTIVSLVLSESSHGLPLDETETNKLHFTGREVASRGLTRRIDLQGSVHCEKRHVEVGDQRIGRQLCLQGKEGSVCGVGESNGEEHLPKRREGTLGCTHPQQPANIL